MKSMDSIRTNSIEVLTEADVLSDLRDLLAHGFGRLEVVIQEGYIHTIYPTPTRRGKKPHQLTQ